MLDGDDEASLAARVLAVEHRLLPAAVRAFCEGRLVIAGSRVRVKRRIGARRRARSARARIVTPPALPDRHRRRRLQASQSRGATSGAPQRARALRAAVPREASSSALALRSPCTSRFRSWPAELDAPDDAPLQATITEMPPPPMPAAGAAKAASEAAAAHGARPPRSPRRPLPTEAVPPSAEPADRAHRRSHRHGAGTAGRSRRRARPAAAGRARRRPCRRRVDLVYKAFLGTHGLLIGEAVYRFEHDGHEYRIITVGEAKGLAAIFVRGQGKLESRGLITATGLQPSSSRRARQQRTARDRVFDWETGMVTLYEQKTEALELSTYDPLTLMWQAYFTPPVDDVQDITVATTRRVGRYTLTREADETIPWSQGEIATERWRRRARTATPTPPSGSRRRCATSR